MLPCVGALLAFSPGCRKHPSITSTNSFIQQIYFEYKLYGRHWRHIDEHTHGPCILSLMVYRWRGHVRQKLQVQTPAGVQ